MQRLTTPAIALLLVAVAGCDDSDSDAPPKAVQAEAAPGATPAVETAAAAEATASLAESPADVVVAAAAPAVVNPPAAIPSAAIPPAAVPPGPLPGQPGGPALVNPDGPAGGAAVAVFVPFPPFVIAAPTAGLPVVANGPLPPAANIAVSSAPVQRKPQTELEAYQGVELFTLAPDGALLATFATSGPKASAGHELKIWDLTTGKSRATLESNDTLREMAISPDGTLLATVAGGEDAGELTLWELPGGTKKSTHNWSKYGKISFASDSKRIVTTVGKKGIAILDLATGKLKPKLLKNLGKQISVQASPIAPFVAVGLGVEKRSDDKSTGSGNPTAKELEALRQKKQQQQQQQQQAGSKRKRHKGGGTPAAPPNPNEPIGLEPEAEGLVEIIDLDTLKIRKKLHVIVCWPIWPSTLKARCWSP